MHLVENNLTNINLTKCLSLATVASIKNILILQKLKHLRLHRKNRKLHRKQIEKVYRKSKKCNIEHHKSYSKFYQVNNVFCCQADWELHFTIYLVNTKLL